MQHLVTGVAMTPVRDVNVPTMAPLHLAVHLAVHLIASLARRPKINDGPVPLGMLRCYCILHLHVCTSHTAVCTVCYDARITHVT